MTKIRLIHPLVVDGVRRPAGDIVEVHEAVATFHILAGIAREATPSDVARRPRATSPQRQA